MRGCKWVHASLQPWLWDWRGTSHWHSSWLSPMGQRCHLAAPPALLQCGGGPCPLWDCAGLSPGLQGHGGAAGCTRGSHRPVCGDVGRVVPNLPQSLCLGGAGLMPVRRWGPEEVLSLGQDLALGAQLHLEPALGRSRSLGPTAGGVEQERSIPPDRP